MKKKGIISKIVDHFDRKLKEKSENTGCCCCNSGGKDQNKDEKKETTECCGG